MKKTITFLFALLLIIAASAQVQNPQRTATQGSLPVINILDDSSAAPLIIRSMDIDIEVAANIAMTTFDIVVYNPNDRILEGEFEFPLADGQHIVRYAIDIDSELREGVVVEKVKARVAFENTIRRKIDPGLVEKTKGNSYRTRIYPLPVKGTRRILISVEQTLEYHNSDLSYNLPLSSVQVIDKLSIEGKVVGETEKPITLTGSFNGLRFHDIESGWSGSFQTMNFKSDEPLSIIIPAKPGNESTIITEDHNGTAYFYAHNKIKQEYQKKVMPRRLGIFWDISASGEKRNIEKEKQLLKGYIQGDMEIALIPFSIYKEPKKIFAIRNGNTDDLLAAIDELKYDGGTQLGILDFSQYDFDEILLFSDGLANFGRKEIVLSKTPVFPVSSSIISNNSYLQYMARRTLGRFIDLNRLELASAVDDLRNAPLRIVSVEYNKADIDDLITQVGPVSTNGLSFAGKLRSAHADIKINLGFGNEITTTKTFQITRSEKYEYGHVKRIWAEMKITELDLEYEKNKEAITQLGKAFSVVTQNTSLIVLDRVEDYVEHEITPPPSLQKEYFLLLKEKRDEELESKNDALDNALEVMDELKAWWKRSFTQTKKTVDTLNYTVPIVASGVGAVNRAMSAPPVVVRSARAAQTNRVVNQNNNVQLEMLSSTDIILYDSVRVIAGNINLHSATLTFSQNHMDINDPSMIVNLESDSSLKNSIGVKEWNADAAYLKEFEKTPFEKKLSKYVELKEKYGQLPVFYIDIARSLFRKNDKKNALLILSNIAELKLEDAELIRTLANELLEVKETDLAIETFRDLVKMREEDPQPYRDLALALNETGNHKEAIDLLYKVITGTWDERFEDITAVTINEMNAMIAAHGNEIDLSGIDKRLVYSMPVDVRIVINWSSDNSDIDLWVTDPRKEKCDYQHTETEIGGRLSQDVTQGFGPEEFMLKKAVKGNYKIEVNLFGDNRQTLGGPISIKAELFTDFGKPTQKRRIINFRVTNNKEVIEIGSLTFEN